ncbi:MAG: NAD(P)-dependent oxidoreductase [Exilibacterium sp.]
MLKAILVTKITMAAFGNKSLQFALRCSDIIEVDDLFPVDVLVALKKQTNCKLLLGLRRGSGDHNTACNTSNGTALRLEKLRAAAALFDYIELDAQCDLGKSILDTVPPQKRLISWRSTVAGEGAEEEDVVNEREALMQAFKRLSCIDAFLYRLVTSSGINALEFLDRVKRKDRALSDKKNGALSGKENGALSGKKNVVAYGEAPCELWSRVAAVYKGAAYVFCAADEAEPMSLAYLVRQFGLPELPKEAAVYGICGYPLNQSVSPLIHNAAFRQLGLAAVYLPFPGRDLDALLRLVARLDRIGLTVKGLTVTAPLKEALGRRFAGKDTVIGRVQSANALLFNNGAAAEIAQVESTDRIGLEAVLRSAGIHPRGRRVAVVGCGGSGRTAARVLADLGAEVVLYNRSHWRARMAERLLELKCRPLSELDLATVDVIVNTVPFPLSCEFDLPYSLEGLSSRSVLIDYTYRPSPNALVVRGRQQGLRVVDGLAMLRYQLCAQFRYLTGRYMPASIMFDTLGFYRRFNADSERAGNIGNGRKTLACEWALNPNVA